MPTEKYELIITEKPKVSKRVADALADGKIEAGKNGKVSYYSFQKNGNKVVVASAVGHIFTLKHKKGETGYPIFNIEWIPSADAHKSAAFTKPYLTNLKKLGKNASSVVCACDYDIEGELIGYNAIKFLIGETALKNAKRMKFSELTKKSLVQAYENKMDHLDFPLADAGITRHMLDWYWGINTSRALSNAYKTATGYYVTLSAGRVQTPTLKVLDDREQEIKAFVPEPFWVLEAIIDSGGEDVTAIHETERFFNESEAKEIHKKCKGQPSRVSEIDKRKFNQNPPILFNLGGLQSEAHRLFNFSPKRTQSIAQSLYDAGLISYPRTSSQQLPKDTTPKEMLKQIAKQPDYAPFVEKIFALKQLKPNEGKKTDPAHPCIYPTGEIPKKLDEYEFKLYDLVVKRFFACFGEPAVRESQKIIFSISDEQFLAKGTITLEKNWHELYEPYVKLKEEELPDFEQDQEYAVKKLTKTKKATKPPNRYSPVSIIKQMEKLGIGTKATRANILQTLYDRNYVTDSQITVTQFGSKIIEVLKKRVPELTSEALTHDFEENVEKIRDGSLDKDTVLENAQKMLLKIMDKFKPHIQEIGEALSESYQIARKTQNTLGKCLQCEKGNLIIRRARASGKQFVGCSAYPDCHCSFPLPQFAKIEKTDKPCEHDGLPVIKVIRAGKRPFTMCIDPKCPSKADWGKKKPASDNKDQASDEAKKVDESETPKKSATKKKKA